MWGHDTEHWPAGMAVRLPTAHLTAQSVPKLSNKGALSSSPRTLSLPGSEKAAGISTHTQTKSFLVSLSLLITTGQRWVRGVEWRWNPLQVPYCPRHPLYIWDTLNPHSTWSMGWGSWTKWKITETIINFSKATCHFFIILVLKRIKILIFPCRSEAFQFPLYGGCRRDWGRVFSLLVFSLESN